MEQQIQFIAAPDGVRLAVATAGSGQPLVISPSWISHLELDWNLGRDFFERLARNHLLVRYDKRGTGLSDRGVADRSAEAHVRDLEAIIDSLELRSVTLLGTSQGGPICITYVVRHPENVSRLIVYGGFHNGTTAYFRDLVDALVGLIRADWGGYGTAVMLEMFEPSAPPEVREIAAEYSRQAATAEDAAATWLTCFEFNVTGLLPQVEVPTLVLHRRGDRAVPFQQGREIAADIPGARFVPLEGDVHLLLSDTESVIAAIEEFLGVGGESDKAKDRLPEGMAVVLFTDIASSTALTEQLGDAAFRAKARQLDERLRSTIRKAGGTPVEGKVLGDGVMAVFTSARQAIDGALGCNAAAQGTGLSLHLGIHAGDVIREGNNVYGGAVNIAARIPGASAPGEILVSDIVRGLARTSADVTFEERGEHELKGVGEPQRLFAVRGGGA